ncbi:MAG TPA: hypothetical protein VKS60_00480 [Stellaceae bacterium]|nr:hypothetical protein [Stellaceae bacterium]
MAVLALAGCEHHPTDAERGIAAFQRGYAAMQREDWPTAERFLNEAAQYLPTDAFTQLDLGVTEQHLGHVDEARHAYKVAADLGQDIHPRDVSNPVYAARTVTQLALDNLAALDAGKPPNSGGAAQH